MVASGSRTGWGEAEAFTATRGGVVDTRGRCCRKLRHEKSIGRAWQVGVPTVCAAANGHARVGSAAAAAAAAEDFQRNVAVALSSAVAWEMNRLKVFPGEEM